MADLRYGTTVGDDGVWAELLNRPLGAGVRPALFLDRDGVIVEEVHYLHKVEDMRLVAGAAEVISRANRLGVPVVVVTNQAGIGRGIFHWPDFAAVQDAMLDALSAAGAHVNAVFACPFHANGVAPWNVADHPDRKPGPGMLKRAAEMFRIDMGRSWIVGARAGDVGAGRNAGLMGGMHVLSGHGNDEGERAAARAEAVGAFQVLEGASVADALGRLPVLD